MTVTKKVLKSPSVDSHSPAYPKAVSAEMEGLRSQLRSERFESSVVL